MQERGHRITFFQLPDLEPAITGEGVPFAPIGQSDHPAGSLPQSLAKLGKLRGTAALRFTIKQVQRTTAAICRDGPDAVQKAGVDALLVDQMEPAGGSVAELLGLPFVTVCNALVLNREPDVPPPFTPWAYRSTGWARLRNRLGWAISDRLTRPITRTLEEFRSKWNLPIYRNQANYFSSLAQISQQTAEFDFPRKNLPSYFHYVGPLRNSSPRPNPFPWERLDGRPLVYASLGTLQSRKEHIFRCFAEACQNFDVQLVIAHLGGLSEDAVRSFPGSPLAVYYAPQTQVLKRACLTLTHAGLNTVLDSLSQGVPVVAVPITYEQPAIAARLRWSGTGLSVPLNQLNTARIHQAVRTILQSNSFKESAERLRQSIQQTGGVHRAANIVEQVAKRERV